MQKIYLVDINNVIDLDRKHLINCWSDAEFKAEAEKQGQIYNIYEFIGCFNIGTNAINNSHQWIRIYDDENE